MKVVINVCFGGGRFGLSPEALLWMYEKGYRENLCSIEEYYGKNNEGSYLRDIIGWEKYLISKEKRDTGLVIFTPDKKHILNEYRIKRNEPLLVQCIEQLGTKANGDYSKLKIVEIPDNIEYTIEEYDGREHIAEVHRTWI